ncbi:MAG: chemotaxis protein CheX [Deltaproteobacteria bacterium]|nr:chemotaxis protein CheX [Deltaproteobacteria bacterium]
MNKILAINCSQEITNAITKFLGKNISIQSEVFKEGMSLNDPDMIILEMGQNQNLDLEHIRKIRYSCNFKNLPIVLMDSHGNPPSMEFYLSAGATEILSINDPPAACRHILQSYLIPDRAPLEKEMEYLLPFIHNTCDVLKTMASMEATFKEVYFSDDFRTFGDISGIIGLHGGAEGTLVVTFYWDLAQKIIAKMMTVEEHNINAELIHDGVAELINMIGGSTKKDFVGNQYHFDITLSSVVIGSGHQIGHPGDASIAILIFNVDKYSFALQVCIKPDMPGR